ncbi:MAG: hypothetical protein A2Y56_04510 [Candidatus Aminicenantes bacterium RBG_13_63_10]|nr:MAG: hypothetical protein A2Y56_04510 [Candidatus Aminicenantes bacterium RBG_13_63_10]
MTHLWIGLLNFFSGLEFRIADRLGEVPAVLFHFFLFWALPVIFLYLPVPFFPVLGVAAAGFYIFILIGDIFFSVFGHDKLEKKRGMIDITSVQEIRQEILGALVKYCGGVVSFATIFNGLQILLRGRAFAIPDPSPVPFFDLLFFSIVTIATVGYGDIHPVHWVSRLFTAAEIIFGLGFVLLLFTMLISVYIDIQQKRRKNP